MGKNKLNGYSIGIDMGTNSIGWSVIEEQNGEPKELIDCGSRIFLRSVEDKTPTPKNQKRRNMRLGRRVIQRRHRRKMRLRNYLINKGFLPVAFKNNLAPEVEFNELGDPYELRAKALDKELTPYEFGRVVMHLGTRRGFLSNRKTGFGDLREDSEVQEILEIEDKNAESTDKEEGKVKDGIKKLRAEIEKEGMRTLGEYLATLHHKRNRGGSYERNTDRKMYQEELNKIFQKQSSLNSNLYTTDIKKAIEEIIFYQRPTKWDRKTIGKCSLEPNKNRIHIGRLEFQRFRYWQDINNLSWLDVETGEMDLKPTLEQKELIANALEKKKNLTWANLKDLLNLKRSTKFNLEKVEGKRKKGIKGNATACGIREIIGEKWDLWEEQTQKQLVEDLISYQSKKGLKKRLQDHWKFDLKTAVKLAVLELENGYGNLSLKAINEILPYLKEGRVYSKESKVKEEKGAVQLAGYEDITKPKTDNKDTLGEIPFIPNPIVQKALYEVRRVVNAIIKEYGKPNAIRIEMVRDLEMNTKRYKQYRKTQAENTEANDKAEKEYNTIREKNPHLSLRERISYDNKLKYRLWKESGQRCSYSGNTINLTNLWSDDVEIDHILPYSRSLDNSYMNKVVCFKAENHTKSNKTPREAFGQTEKWNTIQEIVNQEGYPDKKRRNILTEEIDKDFINNQLSDSRYIAKETGKYMRTLGCDVTFTKGGATSWLRHQWGLNNILSDTGQKERTDHRHHAIDATVIALTNRSLYQKIVHLAKQEDYDSVSAEHGLEVPIPLANIRETLGDKVSTMIISHSTNRKLTGSLHEETNYGIRKENGKMGIVVRKNLTDMTDKNLRNIVCPVIKEGFETYVNMRGGLKSAQKILTEEPFKHPKTGDPVRRARVWVTKEFYETSYWQKKDESNGKLLGVMIYGNNHHVEIIKNKKTGKFKGVVVTTMEAAKRARIDKTPIVKINHGEDWEFIMSLCINDMVSVEENGQKNFYRVRKIDRGNTGECIKLLLRISTDGTGDKDFKKLPLNEKKMLELAKSPSTLMAEHKVKEESVNALGHLL